MQSMQTSWNPVVEACLQYSLHAVYRMFTAYTIFVYIVYNTSTDNIMSNFAYLYDSSSIWTNVERLYENLCRIVISKYK
jgi:hypothetical protein